MADRIALRKPRVPNSMVAAAQVLTSRTIKQRVEPQLLLPWQQQAMSDYDTVGEFRFGVGWVANGMSRVNIVAAKPAGAHGDEPTPMDPEDDTLTASQKRAIELIGFLGGGSSGMGQILAEFGRLLTVTGFAWFVAETGEAEANAAALGDSLLDEDGNLIPEGERSAVDTYETWNMYAQNMLRPVDVIDETTGETVSSFEVATGLSGSAAWRKLRPNSLVVKCWRKHPFRPWEPDAPVRAVLGVLEQIRMIQAHISATGRSRLAGAGLLAIPSEADFPTPPPDENGNPSPLSPFQYFMEQLWDSMIVPIGDQENASAIAPIGIAVPGALIAAIKHIRFSTPFDEHAIENLTEAIERFALGMDMPPEVLTGMGDTNHWNAWQIQDTSITLHIDPAAEMFCNAVTEGYLKAALEAENLDPNDAIVWYNTDDLTQPPDLSANATLAWDKILISDDSYLTYLGMNTSDKIDPLARKERILLDVAKGAPTLAPAMLAAAGILPPQVAEAAADVGAAEADATAVQPPAEPEPTQEQTGPPDTMALVAACDGIVVRALERAGAKLKGSIGKTEGGGPQALGACDPATLHTRLDATLYSSLDALLAGAFDRVPDVAEWLNVDPAKLTADLDGYCRALLASKLPHDRHRLAASLLAHSA